MIGQHNLDIKIERLQQRQLLSIAASLFDPLVMITPFAKRIRSFLQAVIEQGRKKTKKYQPNFILRCRNGFTNSTAYQILKQKYASKQDQLQDQLQNRNMQPVGSFLSL